MLNLSEEQQKALMETVNKHIQEETKKSLDAFDKTLDREVSLVSTVYKHYLLLYFFRRYWRFKYKKIRRNLQGTFTLAFYSR